ncbi:MAG: monooxygenase [Mesorhizobium sp.]|uniref:FAD-dependent monooxygenase n=1 Tax=Mesorhizobium sp. TaxID=1871066 RepID=UPI000FE78F88|nr:FAD-dependent monooxygenase [Mesorhizobium sp.]RWE07629.1 MAG: monooxygenase [Mesorhizobium sp.]RWP54416.1 MAG: monooxygenase [Mesorhizobium sp.]
MKIAIVGAGPAGLFFSALLKRLDSAHHITIFERNEPETTYGFGVGFSDGALRFLEEVDGGLRDAIVASSARQDHITLVHQNERVPILGSHFYGIARLRLLQLLQERALAEGVQIVSGQLVKRLADIQGYDLVVGADGVNSMVRRETEAVLKPAVTACRNMWIWYATNRTTPGIELLFHQTAFGLFIGHTYRYQNNRNTFVIECSAMTWRTAGLHEMSEAESVRFCSSIFADFLGGGQFISNSSVWFTPKIVRLAKWSCGQVTLIGDALKTIHPSIGSGTRAAMQDAIALAAACANNPHDVSAALDRFEELRRHAAEKLQSSAVRSIDWYETVEERLHLSPLELAFEFMMRTGKVDYVRLQEMDPAFAARYRAAHPSFDISNLRSA